MVESLTYSKDVLKDMSGGIGFQITEKLFLTDLKNIVVSWPKFK